MNIDPDKNRLLNIYKNEVKKNLKRKFKVSNKKAEIGIKKYGFEKDFLEFTNDYQFVEPEKVAIEVFEDVLEDKHIIKVRDKYVLGTINRETNLRGVIGKRGRKVIVCPPTQESVGRRDRVRRVRTARGIVIDEKKNDARILEQ